MTDPLASESSGPHFILDEDRVVDFLLVPAWGEAVRAGETAAARAEVRPHLDRLCAEGLSFRVIDGRRMFDPVQLNFITDRALSHGDPFWNQHVVPSRRRAFVRFAPSAPPTARYHDPRRITLVFRRDLPFRDRAPGSRVLVSLPVPVAEPMQRELSIDASVSGGGRVQVEEHGLAARTVVGEDGFVHLELRIACTAFQQTVVVDPARLVPADPTDPSVAPFLARDEGIIRVTDAIDAKARRLAGRGIWDTVLALWDSIFDEHVIGSLYHFALDARDPLGTLGKHIDCYVGSALFIALLRSSSIPARLVQGVLMSPGVDQGLHYWAEIWLPPYGWVPADFACSWGLAIGDKRDLRWSRGMLGHLPYRISTLRFPRVRMELGVAFPTRWYSVTTFSGAGQTNEVFDLDTNALALREYYEVTIGEPVAEPMRSG